MNEPTVLGVITARGDSKCLWGKNIALCRGKRLFVWAIEATWESRIDAVFLYTLGGYQHGHRLGGDQLFSQYAYRMSRSRTAWLLGGVVHLLCLFAKEKWRRI